MSPSLSNPSGRKRDRGAMPGTLYEELRTGPRRAKSGPRRTGWLVLAPILAGPVVAVFVVGTGVQLQSGSEKQLLGSWYRWSSVPQLPGRPSIAMVVAVALLVALWGLVAWQVSTTPVVARWVRRVGWMWAAPFALGAPFLSRDVYAYVAQGAVLEHGLNPYTTAPSALGGHDPLVQAVDPQWRSSPAPYGPLALRLAQASTVVGGHGVGAFVVLRLLAVLSVLGVVLLLRRAAPAQHRDLVTWLTLSPLTLLQLVAATHWEAELSLLLVLSVLLARRGHVIWSLLVAGVACEIKAFALVVVAVLALDALRQRGLRFAPRLVAALVACVGMAVVIYPRDPWGWIGNLHGATKGWSPYAPSSTLYQVLGHLHPGHAGLLLEISRYAVMGVAAVVGLLALRRRDLEVPVLAGVLLVAGIGALPTVWPWYVAPAVLLVLAGRTRLWWWGALLAGLSGMAALPIGAVRAQHVSQVADVVVIVGLLVWRPWSTRQRTVTLPTSTAPPNASEDRAPSTPAPTSELLRP
ncbi:MAG: hypothetical protein QOG99_1363 [Frankiales bacterium]|nr:hypothetical protein [Frankiales bacterium]